MKFNINTAMYEYDHASFVNKNEAWGYYDIITGYEVYKCVKIAIQNQVNIGLPSGIEKYLGRISDGAFFSSYQTNKIYPRFVNGDNGIVDLSGQCVFINNLLGDLTSGYLGAIVQSNQLTNLVYGNYAVELDGFYKHFVSSSGIGNVGIAYTRVLDIYNWNKPETTGVFKYKYVHGDPYGSMEQYFNDSLQESVVGNSIGKFIFTSGLSFRINPYILTEDHDGDEYEIPSCLTMNGIFRTKPVSKCDCNYGFDDTTKNTCFKCGGLGYFGFRDGEVEYVKLPTGIVVNVGDNDGVIQAKLNESFGISNYGIGVAHFVLPNGSGVYGNIVNRQAGGKYPSHAESCSYPIDFDTLSWAWGVVSGIHNNLVPGTTNISIEQSIGNNNYPYTSGVTKYDYLNHTGVGGPSGVWPQNILNFTPISDNMFDRFSNIWNRGYIFGYNPTTEKAYVYDVIGSVKAGSGIYWTYNLNETGDLDCGWKILGYPNDSADVNGTAEVWSRYSPHRFFYIWKDLKNTDGIKRVVSNDEITTSEVVEPGNYVANASGSIAALDLDGYLYNKIDASGYLSEKFSGTGNANINNVCNNTIFGYFGLIKAGGVKLFHKTSGVIGEISCDNLKDLAPIAYSSGPDFLDNTPNGLWVANVNDSMYLSRVIATDCYWISDNAVHYGNAYLDGQNGIYLSSSGCFYNWHTGIDTEYKNTSWYGDYDATIINGSELSKYLYSITIHQDIHKVYCLLNNGVGVVDFANKTHTMYKWASGNIHSDALARWNGSAIKCFIFAKDLDLYLGMYHHNTEYDTLFYKLDFANGKTTYEQCPNPVAGTNEVLDVNYLPCYDRYKVATVSGVRIYDGSLSTDITENTYGYIDIPDYVTANFTSVMMGESFFVGSPQEVNVPQAYLTSRYSNSIDRFVQRSTFAVQTGALLPDIDTPYLFSKSDVFDTPLPFFGYLYSYATQSHVFNRTTVDNHLVGKLKHRSAADLNSIAIPAPTTYGLAEIKNVDFYTSPSGTYATHSGVFINESVGWLANHFVEFKTDDTNLSCRGVHYFNNLLGGNYNQDIKYANFGYMPVISDTSTDSLATSISDGNLCLGSGVYSGIVTNTFIIDINLYGEGVDTSGHKFNISSGYLECSESGWIHQHCYQPSGNYLSVGCNNAAEAAQKYFNVWPYQYTVALSGNFQNTIYKDTSFNTASYRFGTNSIYNPVMQTGVNMDKEYLLSVHKNANGAIINNRRSCTVTSATDFAGFDREWIWAWNTGDTIKAINWGLDKPNTSFDFTIPLNSENLLFLLLPYGKNPYGIRKENGSYLTYDVDGGDPLNAGENYAFTKMSSNDRSVSYEVVPTGTAWQSDEGEPTESDVFDNLLPFKWAEIRGEKLKSIRKFSVNPKDYLQIVYDALPNNPNGSGWVGDDNDPVTSGYYSVEWGLRNDLVTRHWRFNSSGWVEYPVFTYETSPWNTAGTFENGNVSGMVTLGCGNHYLWGLYYSPEANDYTISRTINPTGGSLSINDRITHRKYHIAVLNLKTSGVIVHDLGNYFASGNHTSFGMPSSTGLFKFESYYVERSGREIDADNIYADDGSIAVAFANLQGNHTEDLYHNLVASGYIGDLPYWTENYEHSEYTQALDIVGGVVYLDTQSTGTVDFVEKSHTLRNIGSPGDEYAYLGGGSWEQISGIDMLLRNLIARGNNHYIPSSNYRFWRTTPLVISSNKDIGTFRLFVDQSVVTYQYPSGGGYWPGYYKIFNEDIATYYVNFAETTLYNDTSASENTFDGTWYDGDSTDVGLTQNFDNVEDTYTKNHLLGSYSYHTSGTISGSMKASDTYFEYLTNDGTNDWYTFVKNNYWRTILDANGDPDYMTSYFEFSPILQEDVVPFRADYMPFAVLDKQTPYIWANMPSLQ